MNFLLLLMVKILIGVSASMKLTTKFLLFCVVSIVVVVIPVHAEVVRYHVCHRVLA